MKLFSMMFAYLLFQSSSLFSQDRFWIHKPAYQNYFNSPSELAEWNLIEDNGSGGFSLSGTGVAVLTMDNAAGSYANRIFSVNGGALRYLPLDSINGRMEINILRTTGGNQRFFVQAQTFTSSNTYINQITILPATTGNGFFTINMRGLAWPPNADKIRVIIGGENYSAQQGTIEFDYLSYSNSNGSWNNSANWSTTSGGAGGASVPGASNTVIFDGGAASNGSCQVSGTVEALGVSMGVNYNGNVDLQNSAFTAGSSGFSMAGGGLTGGTSMLTINGTADISGGTFINTSMATNFTGNVSISATKGNLNKGSFNFNGPSNQSLSVTRGAPVHRVIIDKTTSLTLGSNLELTDTLVLTNGVINTLTDTLRLGTSVTNPGVIVQGNGSINGNVRLAIFQTGAITVPFGSLAFKTPLAIRVITAPSSFSTIVASCSDFGTATAPVNFIDGAANIGNRSQSSWSIKSFSLSGGTYELSTTTNSLAYSGQLAALHLVLANAVAGTHAAASGTVSNPTLNRTGLTAADLVNSFYVGFEASTLPLKWLGFTAQRKVTNETTLTWKTNEQAVRHYEVQRSSDQYNFLAIATVNSLGENEHTYNYVDVTNTPVAYYRIKSVDLDGRENFSSIIKSSEIKNAGWSVNQAQIQTELAVTVNEFNSSTSLSVVDVQGRRFYNSIVSKNRIVIPMQHVGKGVFFVVLRHNGQQYVQKLIK